MKKRKTDQEKVRYKSEKAQLRQGNRRFDKW